MVMSGCPSRDDFCLALLLHNTNVCVKNPRNIAQLFHIRCPSITTSLLLILVLHQGLINQVSGGNLLNPSFLNAS